MTTFSEKQFAAAQPLLASLYSHPFVVSLSNGTLPKDKFIYYMQQDSLYLIDYGRALALVAARSTNEKDIALGLDFAAGALIAERELHEHYFDLFEVKPVDQRMPACFAYTSHLLQCASLGSLGEAMAALLPCFWIYNEVGKVLLRENTPNNPYDKWIMTYACEEFAEATQKAADYTDRLASECSGLSLQRMEDAFVASCRMEYYFWDDAYSTTTWTV